MRTCLGLSRCTEPWQCYILCPLAGIALTFSAFFDRLLSSAITIWGNKRKEEVRALLLLRLNVGLCCSRGWCCVETCKQNVGAIIRISCVTFITNTVSNVSGKMERRK